MHCWALIYNTSMMATICKTFLQTAVYVQAIITIKLSKCKNSLGLNQHPVAWKMISEPFTCNFIKHILRYQFLQIPGTSRFSLSYIKRREYHKSAWLNDHQRNLSLISSLTHVLKHSVGLFARSLHFPDLFFLIVLSSFIRAVFPRSVFIIRMFRIIRLLTWSWITNGHKRTKFLILLLPGHI